MLGFAAQAAQYNWMTPDSAAAGYAPTYPDPDEPGGELYYAAKGDVYIYHNTGTTERNAIIAAIAAGTWTAGEGAFDTGTFTDGIFDFDSLVGQPLMRGEEFYAVLVANEATGIIPPPSVLAAGFPSVVNRPRSRPLVFSCSSALRASLTPVATLLRKARATPSGDTRRRRA